MKNGKESRAEVLVLLSKRMERYVLAGKSLLREGLKGAECGFPTAKDYAERAGFVTGFRVKTRSGEERFVVFDGADYGAFVERYNKKESGK